MEQKSITEQEYLALAASLAQKFDEVGGFVQPLLASYGPRARGCERRHNKRRRRPMRSTGGSCLCGKMGGRSERGEPALHERRARAMSEPLALTISKPMKGCQHDG
jgi:hypothetical protein